MIGNKSDVRRLVPWPALGLLAGLAVAAAAQAQILPLARSTVPADWPADMTAAVAVPCPPPEQWPPGMRPRRGRLPSDVIMRIHSADGLSSERPQFEPADAVSGTPDRIWIDIGPSRKARGGPVRFELAVSDNKPASDPYRTIREGEQVHVATADGKPILSYYHGKPEPNQRYPLNDFVHPLIGLDGEVLTALRPKDHIHHRGVYWTWVRHEQNGKSLGSWWQPDTIHADGKELAFADGPVFSWFRARHEWVYQAKGSTETMPFVDEQVVCRVFQTSPHGRAIDFDITLTAMVDGISMGGTTELDKGYGGFTFRYGPAADVQIAADGQPIAKDLNHLRARWADWSGRFKLADGNLAGRRSGAAVLIAPDHPDSPPEWITRYYGVLGVTYPGLRMLDMPKGKPLRLRYRVWIHRGDAKEGRVDEAYRAFAADWKWMTARDGQNGEMER